MDIMDMGGRHNAIEQRGKEAEGPGMVENT